jgi:hypothetical protein
MLSYDDSKWKHMAGGYREWYDPTPALRKLESNNDVDEIWQELWNGLHHQGSVGEASYAAVPHLVRIHKNIKDLGWNVYGLVSTIEIERHRKNNPPLPEWLRLDYDAALTELAKLASEGINICDDFLTVQHALALIALARGFRKLGAMLWFLDEALIDDFVDEYLEWSKLYERGV